MEDRESPLEAEVVATGRAVLLGIAFEVVVVVVVVSTGTNLGWASTGRR